MKSRHGSFLYFSMGAAALMAAACSSGGGTNPTGGGGSGGGSSAGPTLLADNLISNFEDSVAVVVQAGTPPRNGYWYPYNDMSAGCDQIYDDEDPSMPGTGIKVKYTPEAPPSTPANDTGSTLALHAKWMGCGAGASDWGAGVGCDLNQPPAVDGGIYDGPKVEYDISAYKGIVFWALATNGSDGSLRVKLNMSDETKTDDGGKCVESSTNKCSDAYGQVISLKQPDTWYRIIIDFADRTKFKQEGWGKVFPWTPAHVVSIQIQGVDKSEPYDFWIDDVYFWN